MKFFIFLFGITVFIAGCTTTPPQKSKFTPAVAKSLLKKGVTTQAQVLSVWGSPNMVTRNSSGREVWTYSKQSYDAKSSTGFGSLVFVGGASAVGSASTAAFEVLITFDSKDIVEDFSVTSSQF